MGAFPVPRSRRSVQWPTGRYRRQVVHRTPVKPDPSKIKAAKGYKVGVRFRLTLSPRSRSTSRTTSGWRSRQHLGFRRRHRQAARQDLRQVRQADQDNVGLGIFKSGLNEIGYRPENGRTYVGDYSYGIWEIDGVNGTPKLIMNEADRRPCARRHHLPRRLPVLRRRRPVQLRFSTPTSTADRCDRPILGKAHHRRHAAAAARSALPRHRADGPEHPRHGRQPHGRLPAQGHAVQAGPGHQGAEAVRWCHPSRQAEGRQQLQDRRLGSLRDGPAQFFWRSLRSQGLALREGPGGFRQQPQRQG